MFRPSLTRLLLPLIVLSLLTGCAYVTRSWITPGVTLTGVRPVKMTAESQTFIVSLNVNNPNDRTLPIKAATYRLELEGHEIADGTGTVDKQIPAFSEGAVDVEVHTNLLDLSRRIPALALSGGNWNYQLSGVLKLADGLIPVPFRYNGEVDSAEILGRLVR